MKPRKIRITRQYRQQTMTLFSQPSTLVALEDEEDGDSDIFREKNSKHFNQINMGRKAIIVLVMLIMTMAMALLVYVNYH